MTDLNIIYLVLIVLMWPSAGTGFRTRSDGWLLIWGAALLSVPFGILSAMMVHCGRLGTIDALANARTPAEVVAASPVAFGMRGWDLGAVCMYPVMLCAVAAWGITLVLRDIDAKVVVPDRNRSLA